MTITRSNGGNSQSSDKQTVLTSLTGDSVNVTTGANTKLSGAVIAATDNQGNDTGKLNLTTNTLTTENLTDTHYNTQSGFSVGANIGLSPSAQDPKPDTKNTQTPSGTKLNSEQLAFNTSTDTRVGKTLATVGEGHLTIGDTQHSTNTENLNRDVTKVNQELYSSSTGTNVDATIDNRMLTEEGRKEIKNQNKELAGNVINGVALAGNIITGNMDVDNAIASFQDPTKMAEAIKANPELAAILDAFTKGEFDNLPKTKEGLQALADATGLQVDVLLTTLTSYQDAKGTTDKNLVALDVNPNNRTDIVGTLGHEESHARGGTSETLADMSSYATQLLSEVAIDSYDSLLLNSLKLELGTGKDSATQIANQVLLANDNQTLLNALNDHPWGFYFERDTNPQLNAFYGNHEDTWNGKFSSNFIKKTNKNLGKYVTLIKTDETELTMLAVEDYEKILWFGLGGELGIGKVELPKLKFITDEDGIKIEAGIGIKTIDGRTGFEVKNLFNSNFSIKGGVTGSLGGIGASGSLNANKKKVGLSGEWTFGAGIGGNLEVTRDK